jgi:hypothetical protein
MEQEAMNPIASVQEGMRLVDTYEGHVKDFRLAVAESLLDPVGINMAIITDRILARGWQPDGFIQGDGCKIFRYKEFEQ